MNFTAPYPMIASGIYEKNEWQDNESFDKQHLLVGPEAKIEFQEQLVAGEQIAENYYIKRFPVWFSFKGIVQYYYQWVKVQLFLGNF